MFILRVYTSQKTSLFKIRNNNVTRFYDFEHTFASWKERKSKNKTN